jgi:hypothetical protein
MAKRFNIRMAGVGGQGVVTASRLLQLPTRGGLGNPSGNILTWQRARLAKGSNVIPICPAVGNPLAKPPNEAKRHSVASCGVPPHRRLLIVVRCVFRKLPNLRHPEQLRREVGESIAQSLSH